jgi:hypothetical protein
MNKKLVTNEDDETFILFNNGSRDDSKIFIYKNIAFEWISKESEKERLPYNDPEKYKEQCKEFGRSLNNDRIKLRPGFNNETSEQRMDSFLLAECLASFCPSKLDLLQIAFKELFYEGKIDIRERSRGCKYFIINQFAIKYIMSSFALTRITKSRNPTSLWLLDTIKPAHYYNLMISALILVDILYMRQCAPKFIDEGSGYGLVAAANLGSVVVNECIAVGVVVKTNLKKMKISVIGEEGWEDRGIYRLAYYANSSYENSPNCEAVVNYINAGFITYDKNRNKLIPYDHRLHICRLILTTNVSKGCELVWNYDYVKRKVKITGKKSQNKKPRILCVARAAMHMTNGPFV